MVSYCILITITHLNGELNNIISYTEAQRAPEFGKSFSIYYTHFILQKINAGYKIYRVHKLDGITQVRKLIHT